MVATLFFFEETYMRYDRPQPQSPRVLREAVIAVRDECFSGFHISETTHNRRNYRGEKIYVCSIFSEETYTVCGWITFFRRKTAYRKRIVVTTTFICNNNRTPEVFGLDIAPEITESEHSRITNTLYAGIETYNRMHV